MALTKVTDSVQNINHDALQGLTDDDHPQYLPVAGTRPMTDTLNLNGEVLDNASIIKIGEISDPGAADANEAWLHADDVAGITRLAYRTSSDHYAIGEDVWVVARNTSGGDINKGDVVYVTGSTGQRPEIARADADLHHHAIGLCNQTVANNGYCTVILFGFLDGMDTSGWTAGTSLYVSGTPGPPTSTAPSHPATKQLIGTVIYQHGSNGIVYVGHHDDSRRSDGTYATPFTIGDQTTAGELRLVEPSGASYTGFKAPALGGNVVYTLPTADAAVSGYGLVSNGAGVLSWVDIVATDHGALTGLSDDDHTQYALLAGRSGGQILKGSTDASENLTLRSTSNATKGTVKIADEGGHVAVGGGAAASELQLLEPSGGGSSYTGFKAPALGGNVVYTMPTADGAANAVLATDGSAALSWAAPVYDIGGAFWDAVPTSSEIIMAFVADRTIDWPANFSGSKLKCLTAANASTVFIVKLNGSQIGDITVGAAGTTGTFTTSSGTAKQAVAGDYLTVEGPASADSAIKNIMITFKGTRAN